MKITQYDNSFYIIVEKIRSTSKTNSLETIFIS